jgi:acetyl-CoA carboxylase carboxyl transferase subunit beta
MAIFKDKHYFRVNLEKKPDESLWMRCKACGELVFKRRVRENNNICPHCGEYFFLTAKERIQRIEEAQEATGLASAIIIGSAAIAETPVVIGVMDFRFIGGSMGSVMGEQICHGMEEAIARRVPFILISSSGGARIQEGIFSLLQMAKTTTVRAKLAEEHLPFISVMTYPTSGGVEASIASLGDVIIAEKGAMIGFAGRRVIQNTIAEELPKNYQTDSFALDC